MLGWGGGGGGGDDKFIILAVKMVHGRCLLSASDILVMTRGLYYTYFGMKSVLRQNLTKSSCSLLE